MLVHICCSVDSHYFLKELRNRFPNEPLIGYFYNPNIHPKDEYDLRFLDVKKSCEKLGITLFEGEYELEEWMSVTKELQESPEKGERCEICFLQRLEQSAKKGVELGEKIITTTLLMSPKKSIEMLQKSGEEVCKKYGLEFYCEDFRTKGGTNKQFIEVKNEGLYQQGYCGCMFALKAQRKNGTFFTELFSPLNKTVLPSAPSRRLEVYKNSDKGAVIKSNILEYMVEKFIFKIGKNIKEAHILPYSLSTLKLISSTILLKKGNLYYLEKGGAILITLEYYNSLSNKKFSSISELLCNGNSFEEELRIRALIDGDYSFNPIVVVENIEEWERYIIELIAHIQLGTKHRVL